MSTIKQVSSGRFARVLCAAALSTLSLGYASDSFAGATFKIDDTIRWPVYQKIVLKYASFLPQDTVKYKLILKKVLDEN